MPCYVGSGDFRHRGTERVGIMLVNSGTPDSPAPGDVRRFLRNLLSDPRIVELPRALWLPILHGIILTTRPHRSARRYRKLWTPAGSPLLALSRGLHARLAAELAQRVLAPVSIELAMLYARPSVDEALQRLLAAEARYLLVVPLFPQYCGTTTGAVFDQVSRALGQLRWIPETRFVTDYHDEPAYIEALRASIAAHWDRHGRTEHLVLSFHGIQEAHFRKGDPYYCKCQRTSRLLAEELGLQEGQWSVSFQSRFGRGRWLQPYTSELLAALPGRGIRSVTVACPGFAMDSLETIDEIDGEDRGRFLAAGGARFEYVPALNDRPEHARALADLVVRHCGGWTRIDLSRLGAHAREATAVDDPLSAAGAE